METVACYENFFSKPEDQTAKHWIPDSGDNSLQAHLYQKAVLQFFVWLYRVCIYLKIALT